jgi:transposase-like protein
MRRYRKDLMAIFLWDWRVWDCPHCEAPERVVAHGVQSDTPECATYRCEDCGFIFQARWVDERRCVLFSVEQGAKP